MIMLIVASAYAFAWIVSREQIPEQIIHGIMNVTENPIILLLLLNLFLLFLGAIMDNISAMVILSGVLIGIGVQIDMNSIQLGAMIVINFDVGMVTPPVGYSLFVASGISGLSLEEISKDLLPFLLVLVSVVLMVAFIPSLTTWLPSFVK